MHREPVSSSVIASLGYDDKERVLEVEFRTGRVYQYFLVPRATFEKLMRAASVGSYFNHEVRPYFDAQEVSS
ncbi:MAG TPA: KTSC domain-containing protein [Thermoanaerobaculia bacterium]|nr:KTSC domain-containing protein [Thermoanaerobaculia bacterium]